MKRLVVVKVGGSLLDWPALPDRLSDHFRTRREDRLLLIAGGGRAADMIRHLDHVHGLGQERAHRLALDSLDLTARILSALLPTVVLAERTATLGSIWEREQIPIISPRSFLEELDAPSADPLPAHWDVTSDSIAARLARLLDSSELVLLKSAPIAPGTRLGEAAALGLVDRFFPRAARGLGLVTYRNLRDPGAGSVTLRE